MALSRAGVMGIALAAGLLAPATGRAGFGAVVSAHFGRWDRNHDGKLSAQEVTALVTDPAVRGEEAAAVAVIHLHQQRSLLRKAALTRDQLLVATTAATSPRREDVPQHVQFEARFNTFCEQIRHVPRELFVGRAPALDTFVQGYLGDCYFLAALGAAIHRDPAAVRRLIHPQPGGSCDIVFGDGHKAHVHPLTDAEIALSSSAGGQGLWLAVLEEAFGQVRPRSWWSGHGTGEDLDAIVGGGDAVQTITLLTGHKARFLLLRTGWNKDKVPPAREATAMADRVRPILRDAMAGRLLVCCGTGRSTQPPGIAGHHDYAVLEYDAAADRVLLWNPWGNTFVPRGRPGLEHGYATEHGQFRMPLTEFVRIFEGVFYETTIPVRRR